MTRLLYLRALLVLIGFSIGTGIVAALPGDESPALPPVDANEWGQHTPRTPGLWESHRPGRTRAGPQVRASARTDFNPDAPVPNVHETAYLDPMSSVIGNVEIGPGAYLAPFASIRNDGGRPIHIGASNGLQDGAVIHTLATATGPDETYLIDGQPYAVHLGENVSLASQAQLYGPARIEANVFVGMQALVYRAHLGQGVVVEPAAKVIGVTVAPGRYVPAGVVIKTQEAADGLPAVTPSYALRDLNEVVVYVNRSLAESYVQNLPASHPR
jgi:carbonic anhydrase/acetyltransferase-like protein (isoleucine patch superfamily)